MKKIIRFKIKKMLYFFALLTHPLMKMIANKKKTAFAINRFRELKKFKTIFKKKKLLFLIMK